MNTKNNPLFSNFNPVTKQEWLDKVNVDLKGEDFNRKLVWKNLSNIDFQPFYNAEDKLAYLTNTGENAQALINYRIIDVASAEDANKLAIKAVSEGVTGIFFQLKGNVAVATLLNEINLNQIAVSFVLSKEAINFTKDFYAYVEHNINNNKNLRGYFDLGIISNYITTGTIDVQQFDKLVNVVKLWKDYPNFKTITISGTTYLDSGSNQVQEVAYTLNSLIYLIEQCLDRDLNVQSVFNSLHVQLSNWF